eukprot:s819_g24.t1
MSATDHNSGSGMMRHSFQFPSSSSAAATMISLSDHPIRLSDRSASPSCSKSSQLRAHPKTKLNRFALGLLWGKCPHMSAPNMRQVKRSEPASPLQAAQTVLNLLPSPTNAASVYVHRHSTNCCSCWLCQESLVKVRVHTMHHANEAWR